ncbi:unnamed protein product [Oikopleura dioica]|uniref:Fcf2 pre-rRNA processing C-terminal domain-containing protein n=1 Tax=Oikopleura dioica TaxID=34765 RepID=E4X9Y5_OIKDI|nr:unnamed protein product [Oikopleura dioica]
MSDTESDSSEDLELELTAEELEEAQQRLLQKEPKKSSGDIVIDLDNKPKSKKYLPPEEFGINLIDDPIGSSYIDFGAARKNYEINLEEFEKKIEIGGDFLKKQRIDTAKSKYAKAKEKETKKSKTAGKKWFDMAAPELTDEVKNDLKLLRYRRVLDSKTFMKNSDRRGDAKFFQLGTVMDSSDDFYNRLTKKQRKATLVDELLADSEFRALQKKRKAKMSAQAMENRGNPTKKKARKIKTLLS